MKKLTDGARETGEADHTLMLGTASKRMAEAKGSLGDLT